MRMSHEAIYRSLFIQSRGVLKKELTAYLRTKRQMRLAKGAQSRTGQGQLLDMISIREHVPIWRKMSKKWPNVSTRPR
ncbi:MAG: hypothetical protein EOR69_27115 [Mesorhizobium sp.]|nr:MAG: hypothetical protein EOR69_27115 [Mesorhizobium sp.]RWL95455.1 MAG: hypothetical protein EOR70_23230 [Mesorhizobium sp.]